jgi:hypothetical protein
MPWRGGSAVFPLVSTFFTKNTPPCVECQPKPEFRTLEDAGTMDYGSKVINAVNVQVAEKVNR